MRGLLNHNFVAFPLVTYMDITVTILCEDENQQARAQQELSCILSHFLPDHLFNLGTEYMASASHFMMEQGYDFDLQNFGVLFTLTAEEANTNFERWWHRDAWIPLGSRRTLPLCN